jgi:hypothetical protein
LKISVHFKIPLKGMGFTQISMVNAIANFIFPKCPQHFLVYSVYLCQKLFTFSLEHHKLSQLAKEWLLIKYNSLTQTNILQIHIRIHPTRKFSKYIYIYTQSLLLLLSSKVEDREKKKKSSWKSYIEERWW